MNIRTIAVIFGSRSAEHDVSVVTALSSIIKPLELSKKYNVVPIYIAKDGQWYSSPRLKDIQLFSNGGIESFLAKEKPIALQINNGFTIVKTGIRTKAIKIDCVFPALHGTHGEDGELMGLLELANVPYVGCSMPSSALCMDKVIAKTLCRANNIPSAEFVAVSKNDYEADSQKFLDQIKSSLHYPLFVKPAHLGSSIGITHVTRPELLEAAIEVALYYDDKVLVEEAVQNLVEITVPIIGNHKLIVANTEEPMQGDEFFDFDTKYLRGTKNNGSSKATTAKGSQGYSHIPARVEKTMQDKCSELAQSVYKALDCSGIARVDLLVDSKTKQIYFNEVNPLPGSLYVHNWRSVGYSNIDLVLKLVELADERYIERSKIATSFETNFLKQF
ncbi:MAG: D-alanine--D-alanine ligase family protein [Candidatus Saccharimonadales bacterium]